MKIARPVRAACFAALALACLVGLGFGLLLRAWDDFPRRVLELAGYVLFVVLVLETVESCRRDRLT
jgi:CHASE2 domain-containing sensor protein